MQSFKFKEKKKLDQHDSKINFFSEKKFVLIYNYYHITTLETGNKFGDIALDSKSQKRTATIITEEDSYLGIMDKNLYEKYFKEANEKNKKYFLNLLMNYDIFKDFSKSHFEDKYYNNFKYLKIKNADKILKENNENKSVYFIKKGEFEISIKKSLNDLNDIILNLKENKTIPKVKEKQSNLFEYEDNFFEEKRLIKIGILYNREVIGLEDHSQLLINSEGGKYYISYFDIECISNIAEVYLIPRELLNTICNREKLVKENLTKFVQSKKKFIIERLENYRKIQIELHKNNKRKAESQLNVNKTNTILTKSPIINSKYNTMCRTSKSYSKTTRKLKLMPLEDINEHILNKKQIKRIKQNELLYNDINTSIDKMNTYNILDTDTLKTKESLTIESPTKKINN